MNWMEPFRAEIESLFAEAAAEIARFPAPLNADGLALLDGFNPLKQSGGTNYIGCLLPFWLNEQLACDPALCRDLAAGNLYAMLHFCLLDDAMDQAPNMTGPAVRRALALGQLSQRLFEQRYDAHFPSSSPFWARCRVYLEDWASAVSDEGRIPADPRDPRRIARKSGPVKLCAAGLLIRAGKEARIGALEEAVDLALATLQLADDWADWREDLGNPGCSAFLTLVRETLAAEERDAVLDEREVKKAVYRRGCLDRLADIADDYGRRLRAIPDVPPMLAAFQAGVAGGIRNDARRAEEETKRAVSGGLISFLSKNKK
ncbi:hypothetical protein [Paenibacillus humicola]|uniref:hypothetical protein n=1 Tax=Paenibacillus humicola TaxID=3110540 RepID=UPI00237ACB6F|nr:hypothetical protein [Paenibacillus humicola]